MTRRQVNAIREAIAQRADIEITDKTGAPLMLRPRDVLIQTPGTIPDWYLVEVE
jgi:hypothetical protein